MGRLLGARYQVDEEIGHGGMATVWSGRDLRLRRPVAVKILDPARFADTATRQRFWREAQAVAALPHPHIVAVYDVAVETDDAYVVMELVDGPSVHTLLQDGPLHRDQAVGIAVQTCAALAAAHSAGIVHRDVTAANLLVNSSGMVKVCDFGIAAWQEAAYPSLVAGTRGYTAPEQAAGGPVDARTDVFGLGCSLYAMLTGAPPPAGHDGDGVRDDLLRAGVPTQLAELTGRLTAADPGQRPGSAEQVAAQLLTIGEAIVPDPYATAQLSDTLISAPVSPSVARSAPGTLVGVASVPPPPPARPSRAARSARPDRPDRWLRPVLWGTAAVVAIVAGLMLIVLASAGAPAGNAAVAGPSNATAKSNAASTTGPAAPKPSAARPADPLVQLRQEIDRLAHTGGIAGKDAAELRKQIQDIEKRLRRDGDGDAADEARELLAKLRDMRGDGDLSDGAYGVLEPIVGRLADTLADGET
ncbi:serine/threonine-protein kinase [Catellatospora sichuanensis]|uniref:serine/threonine-protein kinase n=1 Tax=Catellatospora sichuanensis TaxID=1969805 RepID=UPI001183D083|nr:serine/threonine-protein kinase [Catellatospora sichuanensis]